jgi:5,10-methylenetetrahydrofolate reductase
VSIVGLLGENGAHKHADNKPLLCLEVNPPRGVDVEPVLARCERVEGVDFFNVTDSALAKMKLSGLAFGALLKERLGIEPVVNVSCRDRNVIALQADLLGAWALGVRSIVALTGDAVTVGDLPDAKGVFEVNSIGLLNLIDGLNRGVDLAGVSLKGATDFVPGVVVNPNARNHNAEIKRLMRKREAGGRYALSQPVFDADQAESFFREAQTADIGLFVGLLPCRTARAFQAMASIPGIRVPEQVLERVATLADEDVPKYSADLAIEIADRVRPYVQGFHVISGGSPKLAIELCNRLSSWIGTL